MALRGLKVALGLQMSGKPSKSMFVCIKDVKKGPKGKHQRQVESPFGERLRELNVAKVPL